MAHRRRATSSMPRRSAGGIARARLRPERAHRQRPAPPHGLDAPGKAFPAQHGQHIVSVAALFRRGVDLPAVGKAEQRLDQLAVPEHGVQGREELGARRELPARADRFQQGQVLRQGVQRRVQALHAHGHEPARRLQLAKGAIPLRGLEPHAEERVRGPVPEQPHRADAAFHPPAQVVRLARIRVRRAQQRLGQAVLRPGIELDVPLLVVDDEVAAEVERLQHGASQARVGPIPVRLLVQGDVPAAQGAAGGGLDLRPAAHLLGAALPEARKVRPVLRREDREVLVEVVDQAPVAVEQVLQHVLAVALHARQEAQVRAAATDVHRVKLHAAGLAHVLQRALLPAEAMPADQAVLRQQEPPRLRQSEFDQAAFPPLFGMQKGGKGAPPSRPARAFF